MPDLDLEAFAEIGRLNLAAFVGLVTSLTGVPRSSLLELLEQSQACTVDCKKFADWLSQPLTEECVTAAPAPGKGSAREEGEEVMVQRSPLVEFGLCGIDTSAPPEVLRSALAPVDSALQLGLVAGVLLAYQGFPWRPTPEYEADSDPKKRRYAGHVYPAWSEVRELLPAGVPVSFHLNETEPCPYVSTLLRGDFEMKKLISTLVQDFQACHIQINLNAKGVPEELLVPESPGVGHLREISTLHPDTTFIVPIAKMKRADGSFLDTEPFVKALLNKPAPGNICAFFDSSAGTGKEPDGVPEIPAWYHQNVVGFTGGIHAKNVQDWLTKYASAARGRGCRLISDAQSGIRVNRKRDAPIDGEAVQALSHAVRDWAARQVQAAA